MNKTFHRIMIFAVMIAIVFGSHFNVQAASLSAQGQGTWTVTKSYIVDKGNVGGKGCNDTWTGTVDQPLCTVVAGLTRVRPGEGILLRAGTYPNFTITKSGTSSAYITIASYNGETAVVSGGGDTVLLKGVSYVRIYGLEVKGATGNYGAGIRVTQGSGVSPTFNIIENNVVHDNVGTNTIGILIEDGSNNKVLNNKVYNNYLSGIQVLSHTTASPSGITGNEVVGNESFNNVLGAGNTDGIKLEGAGTKNTLVMNNIVHGNADDGIDTWNTSRNTVVGNVAYGQNGAGDGNGFKLGGGTTGGNNLVKQNVAYNNKSNGFDANGTGGNLYYNNVAYNNGNFGFEDGWKDAPCTPSTCQATFINNIGYNNVRGNLSASAYTAVAHNNLWYSDNGSAKVFYNYSNYSTLSAFYAASGNRLDNPSAGDQSSLQADPKFTNAAGGTFTLQSSSSAVDRGDPANPGQVSAVNRVDIGAVESADSATVTVTSTSDVTYDDKDGALVYSAGWTDTASARAYGGSFKTTNQKTATVTFEFTGQSFSVLYTSNRGFGKMSVYVDGQLVGTINETTSTTQYQRRWDYPGVLGDGPHTLTLSFAPNNTSKAKLSLDAIIVR